MEGSAVRQRGRALALAGIVALLAAGGARPAEARPAQLPTVELGSAAGLAPDGLSLTLSVIASCPERWSVVEARVTVSQPQASGSGTFPLTCIGSKRPFHVTVTSSGGRFQLGPAQATASVTASRGRTAQAQDSATMQLDPTVVVGLADTALLQSGGGAVAIGVTVACPPGPSGAESYVAVSQGNVVGRGFYVPACDGEPHTFTVTAVASQGLFRAGDARALSFADVTFGGMAFFGIADEPVLIVS